MRTPDSSRSLARALSVVALGTIACAQGAFCEGDAGTDILNKSKALYAKLDSYADTGVVHTEQQVPGGSLLELHHHFSTFFRAPRHFLFDFREDESDGGDRYVLRSDDEAVYGWWATTGMEDVYPPGTGASAFAAAAYPTRFSATQVMPLIFAGSGLKGPLVNVDEATLEGTEDVDGHPCYRLRGIARSVYSQTGLGESQRRTLIWIDTETLLVRRVFEDTPRKSPPGFIDRQTTTFEPQANLHLEDNQFLFTPPAFQN